MAQEKLSIVIGTYNRFALLKQCLDSIIGKVRLEHEIIVIDAGSSDGTREHLKGLQGIRLVCDDGLIGQAQSLNRVFKTLESTYVCWLSDDNIVQDGMLDLAASILERDPATGMVALKVKDIRGSYVYQPYLGGIWPSGVLNCNQGMLRTKLLLSLGGFDESFRDYGIDSDLTTRVLLAGYKVVLTKQVAIHHLRNHGSSSWMGTNNRKQRIEAASALYTKKYEQLIHSGYARGYDPEGRRNSLLMRGVSSIYYRVGQMGIPLEKWIKLEKRDWQNLIVGRFISPLDFLLNIHKPYYLVQKVPEVFRENVEPL
jgi:GT2 family glycosyltransferase